MIGRSGLVAARRAIAIGARSRCRPTPGRRFVPALTSSDLTCRCWIRIASRFAG